MKNSARLLVTLAVTSALSTVHAKDSTYPNEVDSRIGTLTFDHGIPTEETSEKLYDWLDYSRAVQAYLWSLSIMGHTQGQAGSDPDFCAELMKLTDLPNRGAMP